MPRSFEPRFRAPRRALLALAAPVLFAAALSGCPREDVLPTADFQASVVSGFEPLTVQFTDLSQSGPSPLRAWVWDFGDGQNSNQRNPRHTYNGAGVYTVSLTVYTARGSRTVVREDLIEVKAVSSFGSVGPAGGTILAGGLGITVPAGAIEDELVVGVNIEEAAYAPNAPEALAALSPAYTIFHNGPGEAVYGLGAGGEIRPATLAFPFRGGGVPASDRDPGNIQLFCTLPNGITFPVLGDLDGATLRVPVTHLPARATYAVVYRPDAVLFDLEANADAKAPSGFGWRNRWRVSLTDELLAQMTALRLGGIQQPTTYTRRNFTEAELQATADFIGAALNEIHVELAGSGLRAPVLANTAGGYGLVFYNFNDATPSTYPRFRDLVYRMRGLGAVVIDPAQLLAIAQRNARVFRDGGIDEGQEINFGGAFAQTLFEASFDGYDYPNITAPSVVLGDALADSRDVFFLQGLRDGLALFFGQRADGLDTARALDPGDHLRLSTPLFFPFLKDEPGYPGAGHEFFLYIARSRTLEQPLAHIAANAPIAPGILEGTRMRLAVAGPRVGFEGGLLLAAEAVDDALRAYVGAPLAELYWEFAQERAVENTPVGQLRPSDAGREPGRLIEERFAPGAIARADLRAPTDRASLAPAALADIAPLSSRAAVIRVNPLATELTLTFNTADWQADADGNGVGIVVYKPGAAGVALAPGQDSITLQGFEEDPDDCYAAVVVLVSNLALDRPNTVSIEAESFAELLIPESEVLDAYVNACDPAFRYSLAGTGTVPGTDLAVYTLEMTSGVWRGAAEVDQPAWRHFVLIVEPAIVRSRTALLVVSGGSTGSFPGAAAAPLVPFAQSTGSVVALVQAVPNQPLRFTDETIARSEDAIIAYSYDKYLDGYADGRPDMTWPALLPMTRAAARAMDAVQDYLANKPGRPVVIDNFAVTGASKRGWTTWLAGASDARVSAVMPLVIDVLNMEDQINHHYNAYGTFSNALRDYVESDIFCRFGTPESHSLLTIVDPFAYRDRLTMPKFISNSTGDQFFLPDSSRFYFNEMPGEKNLYYAPNTDHGLGGDRFSFDSGTLNSLQAFYISHVRNTNNTPGDDFIRPTYSWSHSGNDCFATITVNTNQRPDTVRLWYATNAGGRDFRVETIGEAWNSVVLQPVPGIPGRYDGRVRVPGADAGCDIPEGAVGGTNGWTAYFVQLLYPGPDPALPQVQYGVSTEVRVVPDTYPGVPAIPITTCVGGLGGE